MMKRNRLRHSLRCLSGVMGIIVGPFAQLPAAEIAPLIGDWRYTANQCTDFSNASTWAADCEILDGGTWMGSNTHSDPLRCENSLHPRPWTTETIIEPLASERAGGTAQLQGWQSDGNEVYCIGVFDTASLTKEFGVESSNVSLISINGNEGEWGARREREIACPIGSVPLANACLQSPIADPYRAFDMCPRNGTNPVNLFSGAKLQVETDIRTNGPHPLVLKRYYSTRTEWRHAPWEESGFGRYWRHNYSRSLNYFKNDNFESVTIYRGNGNRFHFHPIQIDGVRTWRATETDLTGKLTEVEVNDGEFWNYLTPDGSIERYTKESGQLHEVISRDGFVTSFEYDQQARLQAVKNSFGSSLSFAYGNEGLAKDRIVSVALHVENILVPASVHRYEYEQTDPLGHVVMLDKVIYPDNTPTDLADNPFKDYLYNEPHNIYYDEQTLVDVTDGPSTHSANHASKLTGVVDENGDRFATYKYQRVLFNGGYRYMLPVWGGHGSPNANGEYANAYQIIRYHPNSHRGDDSSHNGYATLVDALGNARQFHFQYQSGVLKPTKIVGEKCEVCGSDAQQRRYDQNGFLIEQIDFAGNKILYQRDVNGLEVCRLEGISSSGAAQNAPRRIVMTWDSDFRVLLNSTVFAPAVNVDLAKCDASSDAGWIKRFEVSRNYEHGSARLAQITEKSFSAAGIANELPRVTTFSYYGPDERDGLPFQLKQIDGPRQDVNDVSIFRYATDYSVDHNRGDLVEIENALGQLTKYTRHDRFGRVLESVDQNGVNTSTGYHPRGWVVSRTVANHHQNFEYDDVGQLRKTTVSDSGVIEYEYDSAHRLTGIFDAFGNSIHYELDGLGNRVSEKITDENGALRKHIKRVINDSNQVEKIITVVDGQREHVRGFVYDDNGRLVTEIDPRDPNISADSPLPVEPSIFSSRTYDALKRVIAVIDNEGGTTSYHYDVLDNLISTIEPDDGDTSTPQGLTTYFEYNSFGELRQVVSPDIGTIRYSYDEAGNLLTRETASHREQGVEINYHYDVLNRLVLVDYPDNNLDITYGFDDEGFNKNGIGRLTRVADASGIIELSYDQFGNIREKNITRGTITQSSKYLFNNANELYSITTPGGKEIRTVFRRLPNGQNSSRKLRIELHVAEKHRVLVDELSYAPFGPTKSWVYSNGLTANREFDLSYRLRELSHGNFIRRNYLRDAADNVISVNDLVAGTSEVFGYDHLDRLTNAVSTNFDRDYDYDAIGNRREVLIDGLNQAYSYQSLTHHLVATGGVAATEFTFNQDGSVHSAYGLDFEYGSDGRLKKVSRDQNPVSRYTHNALGQRTEKHSEFTKVFHYDLHGRLLEETDQFGIPHRTYVYMDDELIALHEDDFDPFSDTDGDGMLNGFELYFGLDATNRDDGEGDLDADSFSNLSEHDAGTNPTDANSYPTAVTHGIKQIPSVGTIAALMAAVLAMATILPRLSNAPIVLCIVLIFSWLVAQTAAAKIHYVHTDHLGTPIVMTDETQTVTWRANYSPFGSATIDPNSTTKLNIRFPGQYYDEESGLHYNYYRDYDPLSGRYMQSDPIGLDGGINTYVYAK
ncbi:MAG: RHS repeat-associated core domain-containing protein, partial [Gammaproteobacteria bacterium]